MTKNLCDRLIDNFWLKNFSIKVVDGETGKLQSDSSIFGDNFFVNVHR